MQKDYYQLLEIPYSADIETIKKAYRNMAMRFHPDKNSNPEAQAIFHQVKKAYETLTNEQAKALYDLNLLIEKPGTSSKKDFKTAEDLVAVTLQIQAQLKHIERKNIQQELLYHYMLFLQHRESNHFLLHQASQQTINTFVHNAIFINSHLLPIFQIGAFQSLGEVAELCTDEKLKDLCKKHLEEAIRQERLRKQLPYWMMLCAIIICVLIYWMAKV